MNALSKESNSFHTERANIYDRQKVGLVVKERSVSRIAACVLLLLSSIFPSASSQLLPEADIECDDLVEIDPSTGFRSIIVNCEVTNPSSGSENIEFTYEAGVLTASGPESLTLGAGESESFDVVIGSEEGQEKGSYEVNVSGVVTEWNGVPVNIFGFSDEEVVEVEILPYTQCSLNPPSALFVDAGEDVSFSARYECSSNEENRLEVSLHLLEKDSTQEGMWPSGFNDLSDGGCEIQNPMGSVECQFLLTTPPNLQSKWEGCLIIVDESTTPQWSCSGDFSFPLTVNERDVSPSSVGIDVNGSILEDFGVTEENQNYVIGGSLAVVVASFALVIFLRKRN